MKKATSLVFSCCLITFSFLVLGWLYWPFADKYLIFNSLIGDEPMHLSNIILFAKYHAFPITAWQGQWFGGHPFLEGYPWLHYYLIQPLVSFLDNAGKAMNYYSLAGLFLYFLISFLLFFYASKNKLLALLFAIILMFGADSTSILFKGGFFVFTVSQFFLPLILLLVLIARNRQNEKILILASIFYAIGYYAHSTLIQALVTPAILPFLFFDKEGKITKSSMAFTFRFFILAFLLASIAIYSQSGLYFGGGSGLFNYSPPSLIEIGNRIVQTIRLINPLLYPLAVFGGIYIAFFHKKKSVLFPYFLSFFASSLMVIGLIFNLPFFSLALFYHRAVWALSLMLLLLFAFAFKEILLNKKQIFLANSAIGFSIFIYIFALSILKIPLFLPSSITEPLEKTYLATGYAKEAKPPLRTKEFDNYRTDGLDYTVYAWWNMISFNQRFSGWFLGIKGFPRDWFGLFSSSIQQKAAQEKSDDLLLKRSIFFLDWYGIGYIQSMADDSNSPLHLSSLLKREPLAIKKEESGSLIYYELNRDLIGPIYAPSNAKTIAVVSSEAGYDNIIRVLSNTKYSAQKLISLFLGSDGSFLKKEDLKNYDAIWLYGYKDVSENSWIALLEYVKNGGNLIIDTGQKVKESEQSVLPQVFPMEQSSLENISSEFEAEFSDGKLSKEVDRKYFSPLSYNYLPFSISKTDSLSLRDWANPLLKSNDIVLFAYGSLGEGKVVWSGLNLPFHIRDTSNMGEIKILENVLNWFFPNIPLPVKNFTVSYPRPEEIIVSGKEGKGVLIKENYDLGWQVYINDSPAKIMKAGLFEMYIPLQNNNREFKVKLIYRGSPIYWILFAQILLVFIFMIIYLLLSINILRLINKRLKINKGKFAILGKDQEDEEY